MRVALADYGGGNVRSLASALTRAGAEPVVTTEPSVVAEAALAVIAGVGHVEAASAGLARSGLDEALLTRIEARRPVAGICVGMQLLFEESEEGGRGLGVFAGHVERVRARRVPHMGWNTLAVAPRSAVLDGVDGADVYFAHSYAVSPASDGDVVATVDHDGRVVAAVESRSVCGMQFHPERSGSAGAAVLENLLRWSRSA